MPLTTSWKMARLLVESLFEGVIAFGATLSECEDELRSTLEDWIFTGLKLGHPLPVIAGIDLNRKPSYEPVDAV